MVRDVSLFVLFVLLATPAMGQDFVAHEQLRKVKVVRVVVTDNLGNGCVPQPHVMKIEAEQILRRSGIILVETNDRSPHYLDISWLGATPSMHVCATGVTISLQRFELLPDKSVGNVQAYFSRHFLSDLKINFQQRLRETVGRHVNLLANEILKAREK